MSFLGAAELGLVPLGWTLVNAAWQTALLALLYAAWRAHARPSLARREQVAALALLLGLAPALAGMCGLDAATVLTARAGRSSSQLSAAPVVTLDDVAHTVPQTAATSRHWPNLRATLDSGLAAGAVLWAGGVVFLGLRMLGGSILATQIRRRGRPVVSPWLAEAHARYLQRLGIRRGVELLESAEIGAPATVGWRRPAVLFPAELVRENAREVLEPLLAHELAHVRAGDYAANLLQTTLDALLHLCPGSRWLSSELRRVREYRCDDAAVALSGGRAVYVRALAGLAEAQASPRLVLASSAAGPGLVDRVRRLMRGDVIARPRLVSSVALAASIAATAWAGLGLLAWSRAFRPPAQGPPAASESVAAGAVGSGRSAAPWGVFAAAFPGNEFVPQDTPDKHFYCNPVRLDGQPIDWRAFTLASRGLLTMVHGEPASSSSTRIPFRVSLRRDGELVSEGRSTLLDRELDEADLAGVLAFARPGDHLILEPTRPIDWRAKRIVTLTACWWCPASEC